MIIKNTKLISNLSFETLFTLVFIFLMLFTLPSCGTKQSNADASNTVKINDNSIKATIHQPNDVYEGYLLWHQADELKQDVDNISFLADSEGNVVHTWPTDLTGMGAPAYLLENGLLLRAGIKKSSPKRKRLGPVASTTTVQMVEASGKVVWEYNVFQEENMLLHHDLLPLPNGNILLTTYEAIPAAKAKSMGWESRKKDKVWSDCIIELKPDLVNGGGEIIWKWSFADHIIQDKYPAAQNFGVIGEHPEKIDPNYPKNYAPRGDVRQHINSLDYNAELDQILFGSFIYNEIWIIDHSTNTAEAASSKGGRSGKGGDLLFRYGNPEVYDMGTPKDRIFLKQHDANWIKPNLPGAGNILVLNNNTVIKRGARDNAEAGRLSQVYELRLPIQSDGNYHRSEGKPFEVETILRWEDSNFYAAFQGGARRLPNGNTLLTDTVNKLVLQVNAKGEIVAEYKGVAPAYKTFMYDAAYVSNIIKK